MNLNKYEIGGRREEFLDPAIMTAENLLRIACAATMVAAVMGAIGVNWGTQTSHPMEPPIIVRMLKANGIGKVKLFDVDSWTMNALSGSGLEVMVAIPNYDLERLSSDYGNAKAWVKHNVTAYDGVNVKYVAVGNEAFLTSYNGAFLKTTLPAMKNIQKALNEAGVGKRIKVVSPLNADVYGSPSDKPVPSAGDFRSDIHSLMVDIVKFLHANDAPFVVNIYPFLSLYQNADFPVDFAFFDGGGHTLNDGNVNYDNMYDANLDTLVWSLKKAGVPKLKIVVGEAGWPTDGDKEATIANAKRFYNGFLKKLAAKKGTPLRPGEMDTYLFGLIDENMKSVLPGNFERHWGIYYYDGKPKFPMDLSGKGKDKHLVAASGVRYLPNQWCILSPHADLNDNEISSDLDYACQRADCTPIMAGGSCSKLERRSYISYAFNMYFQMQDQDVRACGFNGKAKMITTDASVSGCHFPIEIISAGERAPAIRLGAMVAVAAAIVAALL